MMCWYLGADEKLSLNSSSSSILWEAQIGFQSRVCPLWWILFAVEFASFSAPKRELDERALFLFGTQRILNDYVKKWATQEIINPNKITYGNKRLFNASWRCNETLIQIKRDTDQRLTQIRYSSIINNDTK